MNESGQAVGALMRRHRVVDPTRLIVVHDELDLEVGVVRVKAGGGLAGHNGLRSITQHLHTQDYLRVRIGVGKPRSKEQGADHVLSRVPKADREVLDVMVERAAGGSSRRPRDSASTVELALSSPKIGCRRRDAALQRPLPSSITWVHVPAGNEGMGRVVVVVSGSEAMPNAD
jgi:hypothetical protein